MTVIRGATTIDKDAKEDILSAVKELIDEIFVRNSLKKERVKAIVFSLTTDIHSYHPAKAARECGYDFCALFACVEPDIRGALGHCLRAMILSDEEKADVRHVYLRGAKKLREDISLVYNIALDGPAGSGKSTIAKILAEDYHILYLDTGAMYRACALRSLKEGISPKDAKAVQAMTNTLDLKVEYREGTQHTILDGEDVSEAIRRNEVSLIASDIAAQPVVREKMVEMQRKIAKDMSCVLDGRDIGSTVLPDAKFKFFITAKSEVRALRRFKELAARGQTVDFETLKAEIEKRDKQDEEREFSPLKCADDAVVIDTSDMTIEEVVAKIKSIVQSRI
jgi:cytidylate kinase